MHAEAAPLEQGGAHHEALDKVTLDRAIVSSLSVADVKVEEQVGSALTSIIFNTGVRCDVRTASKGHSPVEVHLRCA